MKIKGLYIVIAFLVLIVFGIFQTCVTLKFRSDYERIINNYKTEKDNIVKKVYLTDKEFKEIKSYKGLLDSINIKLNEKLNPKQVTEIKVIKHYYKDTTIVEIPIQETKPSIYPVNYSGQCWGFNGYVDLSDSYKEKFILTNKFFNNKTTIAYFWKPRKLLGMGLRIGRFTPFGKNYFIEQFDKCKGLTEIEEINISK